MDIKLINGRIAVDDKLYLKDGDIKTNLYLIKFLLIVNGLSFMLNGYRAITEVNRPLEIFFIILFIFDIIVLILIFKRSSDTEIEFNDIKKVNLKKFWKGKNSVVLKLQNGKNRLIGGFKNIEDAKYLVQFINSKINSKS
jgi:hypothetical protein